MAPASTTEPAVRLDGIELELTSDAGPVQVLRGIDLAVAVAG